MWFICTKEYYYPSIKNNEIFIFRNGDGTGDHHAEQYKPRPKSQISRDFVHMEY
jgi:hypothetical protein